MICLLLKLTMPLTLIKKFDRDFSTVFDSDYHKPPVTIHTDRYLKRYLVLKYKKAKLNLDEKEEEEPILSSLKTNLVSHYS